MTEDARVVYVVTAGGRIHRGVVVGDQVMLDERCNIDDSAGDRTLSFELPESASDDTCCDRCLPGSWSDVG